MPPPFTLVAAGLPGASGVLLVRFWGICNRLPLAGIGLFRDKAVLFLPPPAIICPMAGGNKNGREASAPTVVLGLVYPNPQRHECRFQNAN